MKQYLLYMLLMVSFISCRKYLSPDSPGTQLDDAAVFRSDATATAALLSIYARMESDGLAYSQIVLSGLSSDEMINYSSSGPSIDLYVNNLTSDNPIILAHWRNAFKYIYQANAVIEGVTNNRMLSAEVRKQLEGEARFLRAFCYFYLVNCYSDVPLVTTTDYRTSAVMPRTPAAQVNEFIAGELQTAITLLSEDYVTVLNQPGDERVRANKTAARALLARQYLYQKQWVFAEEQAAQVMGNTARYELLTDLNKVFLKNSREAILQWQNQYPAYNSYPGANLILNTVPTTEALDTNFVKSFTPTDKRKQNWIGTYTNAGQSYFFPFKYKIKQNAPAVTEYTMVLRLGEIALIRAEARAMQDKLTEAETDLNTIRMRAGLLPVNGLAKPALLDSIHSERRRELFGEFGDRWLDVKRTGTATAVLQPIKAPNWAGTDTLYPIPQAERLLNSQLTQNNGY